MNILSLSVLATVIVVGGKLAAPMLPTLDDMRTYEHAVRAKPALMSSCNHAYGPGGSIADQRRCIAAKEGRVRKDFARWCDDIITNQTDQKVIHILAEEPCYWQDHYTPNIRYEE